MLFLRFLQYKSCKVNDLFTYTAKKKNIFSLYLENNQTCNMSLFSLSNSLSTIYSQANRSFTQSVNYLKEVSQTFSEMDLSLSKLSNLNVSLLQNLVKNFATVASFIRDASYSTLTLFLYPPEGQPNLNLSLYASLIDNEVKAAFFKSRYSFLNVQFYMKTYGILGGSLDDIQKIMPLFIGTPFLKQTECTSLIMAAQ